MQEADVVGRQLLPTDTAPAVVLEPRDSTFNGPATAVPAKQPAILPAVLAVSTVGRDEIGSSCRQLFSACVPVMHVVPDDTLGPVSPANDDEESLDEHAFVSRGRGGEISILQHRGRPHRPSTTRLDPVVGPGHDGSTDLSFFWSRLVLPCSCAEPRAAASPRLTALVGPGDVYTNTPRPWGGRGVRGWIGGCGVCGVCGIRPWRGLRRGGGPAWVGRRRVPWWRWLGPG